MPMVVPPPMLAYFLLHQSQEDKGPRGNFPRHKGKGLFLIGKLELLVIFMLMLLSLLLLALLLLVIQFFTTYAFVPTIHSVLGKGKQPSSNWAKNYQPLQEKSFIAAFDHAFFCPVSFKKK